ncbi:MAG: ABC transporter permease [Spirochaetes bacterium]|nr:ABC transporter permease [Spirochaetota bacterium]
MKIYRSLVRITVIADKEWIQIRRDTRSLIFALIAPFALILLFGYALTMDVKNVSMAVYDQDRTTTSRQFLEKFSHTDYLHIYDYVSDYSEIDRLIDKEDIKLAVVIPDGFEKRFKSGKKTDIQLLADGSDSTSATVAIGYVKAIIANYNIEVKVNELKRIGISETKVPVETENRIWFNPELLSKNFIIPGLIVIMLSVISALIASLTISREWERGTMETLITTPLRSYELVLGKLIPYIFIGVFGIIIMLLAGFFIFDVPFKGSLIELIILGVLFLIGTTSLGMMISSVTRVQVLSVQLSMVITYMPAFILSDFIFPVANMPLIIQVISYIVPAKYLIIIFRGIILKGISYSLLWTQIVFLAAFALIMITISIKKITLRLPE